MFIRIETTSGMPITRQIMDQIRALVASKALEPGDRLLSVRALAHELAVNQNTVLRVYERLTAEGLLERRRGNGTFVAAGLSRRHMKKEADQTCLQIETLVRRAEALGVDRHRLHELIDRALRPESPSRRRQT